MRYGADVAGGGTDPMGGTRSPYRKYSPTENRIRPASNSQRTIRLGGSESSDGGGVIGRYSSGGFYIKEWHTIPGP